jgi:hypothetical protein
LLKEFGQSSAGIHALAATPCQHWLLAASLDGHVAAYDLESFTAVFTMKLRVAVHGLKFYKEGRFVCYAGEQVMGEHY